MHSYPISLRLQGITCLFCRFGLDFRLTYFSELIVNNNFIIIIIILFVYASDALIRLGPAGQVAPHTHRHIYESVVCSLVKCPRHTLSHTHTRLAALSVYYYFCCSTKIQRVDKRRKRRAFNHS